MNLLRSLAIRTILLGALPLHLRAQQATGLTFESDEARAALSILETRAASGAPAADQWNTLFTSAGYRRLAARERAMGREMPDSQFAGFLMADSMAKRAALLRRTLRAWESANLQVALDRAHAYLPSGTPIQATIYPLIKPRTNSFVFEASTNPAIMLFLDPDVSPAKFTNTVAHELHHIGYNHACPDSAKGSVPRPLATAIYWMGAFGEGYAMLAAAGGPQVHPHAASEPAERQRWDKDMRHIGRDFADLDLFFRDVLQGKVANADSVQTRAMEFFGVQGPWYTVGYTMARSIERARGRQALVGMLCDPVRVMREYQRIAARGAPRWSGGLLALLPTT
ncbi:MAG: DUF5700 domain-containing putative Zn-dependent protease [Gemmatimonadaceae bacterium]